MPDEAASRAPQERVTTAVVLTLFIVLVHGLLVLTCDVALLYVVPRYVRLFSDMQAELPTMTKALISASMAMRNYWYVLLPAGGVALVVDGWVFFVLRTKVRSRLASWVWVLTGFAVLGLAVAWIVLALQLPLATVTQRIGSGG